MTFKSLQFPRLRRLFVPVSLALFVLFLVFSTKLFFPGAAQTAWLSRLVPGSARDKRPSSPPPTLPELKLLGLDSITGNSTASDAQQYCNDRFGPTYLTNLRDNSIEYCAAPDQDRSSRLTCFHSHVRGKGSEDSLCIAQGAVLDPSKKGFVLNCDPRAPTLEETKRGLISFQQIRSYWYDTGPGVVFGNYVGFVDKPFKKVQDDGIATKKQQRPPISILVKREGSAHPWHSLMEIWALTHTMDVLRLSANPDALGAPFYTPDDVARAQVVILDDAEDGPFFNLWTITAGKKPVRLSAALDALQHSEKPSSPDAALVAAPGQPHNIVVPLAGAANPLWQNDWDERNCSDASLVKLFVRRVLHHLGVDSFKPKPANVLQKKLRVTFVDRRGSRKLLGQERLLDAARRAYPDVQVRSVDFATLSFVEQIRLVRHETDVLVGVHGAGLTHVMFLRAASEAVGGGAIVEILPDVMNYKGFRNLAYMLGHEYFSAKAKTIPKENADKGKDGIHKVTAGVNTGPIAGVMKNGMGKIGKQTLRQQTYKRQLEARRDLEEEEENKLLYRRGAHLEKRADWHSADVSMGEEEFVKLVGSAIEHVRNKA
ncbi:hypothetical protein MCOR27_006036 [Pyricularia oryzae]|nr:hypothetical protein MCOR26_009818 [Pyricularia oryzae]KAI6277405.1 hypothetical protein MCOR27_006036 [Pyricularia oryzae]KAI6349637.1 hypothetical protein MCOR28_000694 [Pyricularia oryzae]KAI6403097.1 hypothetical protein MCOR23_003643 [Pyricularia oryzae]KAI6448518.1 hypothetical protein MCOR22_002771 [Pyricularia oryzae]